MLVVDCGYDNGGYDDCGYDDCGYDDYVVMMIMWL